jgi:hypothetical protein
MKDRDSTNYDLGRVIWCERLFSLVSCRKSVLVMRSKHGTPNLIAYDMDRSVSQGARPLADVDRNMLGSCLRLSP